MKVIIKKQKDPSQKKTVIDLHRYARNKNRFFRISVFINIIQLGIILALAMRSN